MSYTALFGNFQKRQNSTAQPDTTDFETFSIVLKDGSSLETPVFKLKAESFDYNYCYFREKYYFVTDITAMRNDLYEVTLSLDPLATYKSQILASTQFVSYSSVSGGTWLADTRVPVMRDCSVSTSSVAFPAFVSGGLYILSYIGKTASGLVALGYASLLTLINNISGGNDDFEQEAISRVDTYFGGQAPASAEEALYALAQVTTQNDILGKAYSTAPSCLRSCIYTPLAVSGTANTPIYLGNFNTQVTGIGITGTPITGSVSLSIPWQYSDWRRGYCEQVYLYLPLVGMVSLSADSLTHASTITVNYSYTLTDATVAFQVVAGDEIVGTYGGSCAINYPLGINQQASAGQVMQSVIQGAMQAVSGGITGMAMGAATIAYTALDASLTTHPSSVGGIGGGAGSGLDRNITCYTVAHSTVIEPSAMQATMGLPTMQPLTLSSCSGYCQCANAHVALDAPLPEIQAVDGFLNSGFYIE